MYHYTAIVTLLAIAVYFYSSILVSRARGKFGVKLPAISGNPDFERVFRAQMNTLEWLPIFLPSLWLFAIYIGDGIAAGIGLVWVIGRILYVLGYGRPSPNAGPALRSRPSRPLHSGSVRWAQSCGALLTREYRAPPFPVVPAFAGTSRGDHFTNGQPESLAAGKALSPGTTASCL